ncbi:hypothetical protein M9Y10_006727 [Tritrichomonas musculus]|uniref:Bacterial bifunctional deaminase-reductase C-terminal domain-containing protein n=1 Tax=Tritrichomonas musculus TaxID=1915356 RepID=A0ABR2JG03_9EUKA
MDRAKVIIHMYTSIDGKIDGDWMDLPGCKVSGDYYDNILFQMGNANANGSNTVVMYAAKGHPDLSKYKTDGIEYEDWVPNIKSETWDVSFDRKGRAGWEKNYFEYGGKKSRAIEVITKLASKEYMAFLRSMEIPYIVCGDDEINFEESLIKIKKYFGIDTMVLGGGALINGAFLKAGLVDEISIVIGPYVSGDTGIKDTFDTNHALVNQLFKVKQVKQLDDGGIHLIYEKS